MPRKPKAPAPSVTPEPAPKKPRVRNKRIPIGKSGLLWLRIGRMTKAELDDFWRRNGQIVGFTRPAPINPSPSIGHHDQ